MSMSFGARLRTMSRTQPPAKYAMWPCSRSFAAMVRAVPFIVTVNSFALRSLVGQPFPVASWGSAGGLPARRERLPLPFYWRESIASTFGRGQRFLAQGMNDEADHRDTDAGVSDVESRPRIGKANM